MIKLTRLNGSTIVLNCDLIESVEETPDTVVTTTSGKKFVVEETIEQIVDKVVQYKGKILFVSKDKPV
ncbi:MAG TPA: flagellar FlbD family protein [Pseudobacteroides sp.]|nr:flagellar FlbD family protein [Pseudobacteroides sp.]